MPMNVAVVATSEYGAREVRIGVRVDPEAQIRTVELRS
jgi:hypothetical protein